MLIEGKAGLLTLLGARKLIPSIVTITQILSAIGENNARLDQDASRALRDLFITTGEMSGDLQKVLNESLEEAFKKSHDRAQSAILEALVSIDSLDSLESDHKAQVMKRVIEGMLEARKEEIQHQGELKKIFAMGSAASLVILAASIGYKYARKPTFMESLQQLIRSL